MTMLDRQVGSEIRPFTVQIPKDTLDDLRRRLAATCLPGQEIVGDRSQGVQLATLLALCCHWTTEYHGERVALTLDTRHRPTELAWRRP